jgi:hypothetical protein
MRQERSWPNFRCRHCVIQRGSVRVRRTSDGTGGLRLLDPGLPHYETGVLATGPRLLFVTCVAYHIDNPRNVAYVSCSM